jgi:DNA-directed RNA polymerase subunit RPC12/RpoP
MKIPCPNCNQRLDIPEELSGQTIECPACNGRITVPALDTLVPEQNDADADKKSEIPSLQSRNKTKSSIKPSYSSEIKKIKPVARMINESVKGEESLYKKLFKKKALIMISCLSLFAFVAIDRGIGIAPMFIAAWWGYKYVFPNS